MKVDNGFLLKASAISFITLTHHKMILKKLSEYCQLKLVVRKDQLFFFRQVDRLYNLSEKVLPSVLCELIIAFSVHSKSLVVCFANVMKS